MSGRYKDQSQDCAFFLIQNGFHTDFKTFRVILENLPDNSNYNFIVDWYNWNCQQRKLSNRWADKRKYFEKKYNKL